MLFPEASKNILRYIRGFLGEEMGAYYILTGFGMFLFSVYLAFSKYGRIRLGDEKKEYSDFKWGTMIFTSTMAADILFYSLCEWALYAADPHIERMGEVQEWAPVYPLFHWGPIAFPVGIIAIIFVAGFVRDAGRYLEDAG